MRQFHLEASARSPEWSLGDYTRTEMEPEDGAEGDSVALTKKTDDVQALSRVADVFDVGGQRCDETGTGRRSTVHFKCCDGPRPSKEGRVPGAPPKGRSSKKGGRGSKAGDAVTAFVMSVDEIALCQYSLAVCSPSLCSPSSPNATAALLLKALEGVCLQRHEGWWSFEFCYKKGARQFHARPGVRPPFFSPAPSRVASRLDLA